MSTAIDRTTWVEQDAPSSLGNPEPERESAITALAANSRATATGRLVRQYYRAALAADRHDDGRGRTDNQPVTPQQTATPSGIKLEAPILPAERFAYVVSFHALQEWEGNVTSIDGETFGADLVDMTRAARQADEHVELPIEEIGQEQRSELRLGAVFRWTIGYETLPTGQRRRVSQLVFRQLPRWTRSDIDAAKRQASNRYRRIEWE